MFPEATCRSNKCDHDVRACVGFAVYGQLAHVLFCTCTRHETALSVPPPNIKQTAHVDRPRAVPPREAVVSTAALACFCAVDCSRAPARYSSPEATSPPLRSACVHPRCHALCLKHFLGMCTILVLGSILSGMTVCLVMACR